MEKSLTDSIDGKLVEDRRAYPGLSLTTLPFPRTASSTGKSGDSQNSDAFAGDDSDDDDDDNSDSNS